MGDKKTHYIEYIRIMAQFSQENMSNKKPAE